MREADAWVVVNDGREGERGERNTPEGEKSSRDLVGLWLVGRPWKSQSIVCQTWGMGIPYGVPSGGYVIGVVNSFIFHAQQTWDAGIVKTVTHSPGKGSISTDDWI